MKLYMHEIKSRFGFELELEINPQTGDELKLDLSLSLKSAWPVKKLVCDLARSISSRNSKLISWCRPTKSLEGWQWYAQGQARVSHSLGTVPTMVSGFFLTFSNLSWWCNLFSSISVSSLWIRKLQNRGFTVTHLRLIVSCSALTCPISWRLRYLSWYLAAYQTQHHSTDDSKQDCCWHQHWSSSGNSL